MCRVDPLVLPWLRRVASFTLEEARAMIDRGEIREGKTLIALLLELQRRG